MKKTVYVFEDSGYENLLPLTYTMPVWNIQCGIRSLLEKIRALYRGAEVRLLCRDYLAQITREHSGLGVNDFDGAGETSLFINGRAILNKAVPVQGAEEAGFAGGTLIYVRAQNHRITGDTGNLSEMFLKNRLPEPFSTIKKAELKAAVINYFWDAVELLPGQIAFDFNAMAKKSKKNLITGRKNDLRQGIVFDTTGGPIYIGDGVTIEPNAVIMGPATIASDSIVRSGAIIRDSSIGRNCRVGGEISQSIIHPYSNKQHGGYLGNSYVGSWVNIGAGTNNSDLKNNYGSVKVLINGNAVNTGRLHVGVLLADHVKCAIGTNFTCGTIVGTCSNVLGKPMPPKSIKPFSWGDSEVYEIESAVSTARVAMKRRNVILSGAEEKLLRHIFGITHP